MSDKKEDLTPSKDDSGLTMTGTLNLSGPVSPGFSNLTLTQGTEEREHMFRMSAPSYTPHPHSPEGRLDRLEETLVQLLSAMADGENSQQKDIDAIGIGMPILRIGSKIQRRQEVSYSERLLQILNEYKAFREEVLKSNRYRTVLPGVNYPGAL